MQKKCDRAVRLLSATNNGLVFLLVYFVSTAEGDRIERLVIPGGVRKAMGSSPVSPIFAIVPRTYQNRSPLAGPTFPVIMIQRMLWIRVEWLERIPTRWSMGIVGMTTTQKIFASGGDGKWEILFFQKHFGLPNSSTNASLLGYHSLVHLVTQRQGR